MGKYDGIMVGKIIKINKTYRNMICSNNEKMHTMLVSDSYKDATGTWITTNTYNVRWFGNYDLVEGQEIKIERIISILPNEYKSKKTNQIVKQLIITFEIYNNQQEINNQYEPQYSNSSGGYTEEDDYGL